MVTLMVTGNAFLSPTSSGMGFFPYMATLTFYMLTVAVVKAKDNVQVIYTDLDLTSLVGTLVEGPVTLLFYSSVFCSFSWLVAWHTHFHGKLHE